MKVLTVSSSSDYDDEEFVSGNPCAVGVETFTYKRNGDVWDITVDVSREPRVA